MDFKGQVPGGLTGCGDSFQGCALRRIQGSPSGTQPCRPGCPEVKLGCPNKKENQKLINRLIDCNI